MKRIYILSVITIITIFLIGCQADKGEIITKEDFYKSGINDSDYVELTKINNNVWVHTTYINIEGNRIPANGLVIVTTDGLVLIDTPWTNEQTEELINLSNDIFGLDINIAIVTHAHQDNIGGIDKLLEKDIEVISTYQTMNETMKNGFGQPVPKLNENSVMKVGDTKIETYYPGEGHTSDNIVIWLPEYKLLFGGCLIKSLDTGDLGNIKEANLKEWPLSLERVKEQYPDIKIIVPGHGDFGDLELLEHTLNLLKQS